MRLETGQNYLINLSNKLKIISNKKYKKSFKKDESDNNLFENVDIKINFRKESHQIPSPIKPENNRNSYESFNSNYIIKINNEIITEKQMISNNKKENIFNFKNSLSGIKEKEQNAKCINDNFNKILVNRSNDINNMKYESYTNNHNKIKHNINLLGFYFCSIKNNNIETNNESKIEKDSKQENNKKFLKTLNQQNGSLSDRLKPNQISDYSNYFNSTQINDNNLSYNRNFLNVLKCESNNTSKCFKNSLRDSSEENDPINLYKHQYIKKSQNTKNFNSDKYLTYKNFQSNDSKHPLENSYCNLNYLGEDIDNTANNSNRNEIKPNKFSLDFSKIHKNEDKEILFIESKKNRESGKSKKKSFSYFSDSYHTNSEISLEFDRSFSITDEEKGKENSQNSNNNIYLDFEEEEKYSEYSSFDIGELKEENNNSSNNQIGNINQDFYKKCKRKITKNNNECIKKSLKISKTNKDIDDDSPKKDYNTYENSNKDLKFYHINKKSFNSIKKYFNLIREPEITKYRSMNTESKQNNSDKINYNFEINYNTKDSINYANTSNLDNIENQFSKKLKINKARTPSDSIDDDNYHKMNFTNIGKKNNEKYLLVNKERLPYGNKNYSHDRKENFLNIKNSKNKSN